MNVIGDKGINYENYKNLLIDVIYQACLDYGRLLSAYKRKGERGLRDAEKEYGSKESIERFFNENGPYFSYAELDGPSMLKQMKRNFKKHGKVVLNNYETQIMRTEGTIK